MNKICKTVQALLRHTRKYEDIQGVSKTDLQWCSKCYCVASVTKTFILKGVQSIHRSRKQQNETDYGERNNNWKSFIWKRYNRLRAFGRNLAMFFKMADIQEEAICVLRFSKQSLLSAAPLQNLVRIGSAFRLRHPMLVTAVSRDWQCSAPQRSERTEHFAGRCWSNPGSVSSKATKINCTTSLLLGTAVLILDETTFSVTVSCYISSFIFYPHFENYRLWKPRQ
jgi:hypothetical protein